MKCPKTPPRAQRIDIQRITAHIQQIQYLFVICAASDFVQLPLRAFMPPPNVTQRNLAHGGKAGPKKKFIPKQVQLENLCIIFAVPKQSSFERMYSKFFIFFLLLLTYAGYTYSQESPAHFRIRYVINVPEIDSTFVDNSSRIIDMREFLEGAREDSLLRFTRVKFKATASPDGGYEFNQWLSKNRLRTFKELVYSYIEIPDSIIEANISDIPWDGFREKVAESDLEYRDEILAIIDEGPRIVPWFNNRHIDARLLKLKTLHRGKVWESLKEPILRDLRYGDAVFEFYRVKEAPLSVSASFADRPIFIPPLAVPEEQEIWIPRLHLKTNAIGLALLSANVSVEVDLARHWSFALPIYYCGMDWF